MTPLTAAMLIAGAAAAAIAAARGRRGTAGIFSAPVLALAGAAVLLGGATGSARLGALDAGAVQADPGTPVRVTGFLLAPARRVRGEVRLLIATPAGRVAAHAQWVPGEAGVGDELRLRGHVIRTPPWLRAFYRRHGVAAVVSARGARLTGRRRGGLAGRIDSIRRRAEDALGRGMPEREAALARGFVLGQDDAIDRRTAESFRRSGLAHLLAVSGQNVLLLVVLAWPLLALAGLTLRARMAVLLGLIALYVPLAGAGPSIQRAGVMGAAGVAAVLAGRPSSRWYALLLAAAVTLAVNPLAAGDVGWQLSFAAVVGLIVAGQPLAGMIAGGAPRGSPRRALAEGGAATIAATIATAPLMALHFEAVPLAAVPANLLALPAVAPAMWLGMLAAAIGQAPAVPVEPLNWLNSLCLGHIAQVADWTGSPEWALASVKLPGPLGLGAAYLALGSAATLAVGAARRARGLRLRGGAASQGTSAPGARRRCLRAVAVAAAALLAGAFAAAGAGSGGANGTRAGSAGAGFTARFLDVGQGDSILLQPPDGAPVLIDTGPPGGGAVEALDAAGVDSLGALIVTHDQSDHAGAAGELLDRVSVARLGFGRAGPALTGLARYAGAAPLRLAEGSTLRSGSLALDVLWPPRELLGPAGAGDPNRASLVVLARWRHLSILLTGDAEAEATGFEPPPVDVLKVAHHGSEDSELGEMLDRSLPDLAVISVGANRHGHPAAPTLGELAERDVPVVRTDEGGEVVIRANRRGWSAFPAAGEARLGGWPR